MYLATGIPIQHGFSSFSVLCKCSKMPIAFLTNIVSPFLNLPKWPWRFESSDILAKKLIIKKFVRVFLILILGIITLPSLRFGGMTLHPKLKEKKYSPPLTFEKINTPSLPHFVFISNELLNFHKNLFTKV